MNTKRKLNCYIFSNLIISFLTLNLITNTTTTNLIKKTSSNVLNKIYEKGNVEYSSSSADTIISSEAPSNVLAISNKVVQSSNNVVNNPNGYVKPSYNSLTGTNLVNYAKNFLGLRYVSAGRSLATGTDCSGFTSLIYAEFGITLGRTVASQVYSGTYVAKSDLEPGDLVFYSYGTVASHVAIYIGNGQIIHESNPRDGVKISTVNIMNYITARRVITAGVVSSNTVAQVETVVETPQPTVVEPVEEVKIEVENNINLEKTEVLETNTNIEIENNNVETETKEVTKEEKKEEVEKIEVVETKQDESLENQTETLIQESE